MVFDAVRARSERLVFWEGGHADWPDELIAESVTFLNRHLARGFGRGARVTGGDTPEHFDDVTAGGAATKAPGRRR